MLLQVDAVTVETVNRVLIGIIAACLGIGGKFIHAVYNSLDKRVEKLEDGWDSVRFSLGRIPDRRHPRNREE